MGNVRDGPAGTVGFHQGVGATHYPVLLAALHLALLVARGRGVDLVCPLVGRHLWEDKQCARVMTIVLKSVGVTA